MYVHKLCYIPNYNRKTNLNTAYTQNNNTTKNIYKENIADTFSFKGSSTSDEIDELFPIISDVSNIEINCPTEIDFPSRKETIKKVFPNSVGLDMSLCINSPYEYPNYRQVALFANGAVKNIDDYIIEPTTLKNMYGDSFGDCKKIKRTLRFDQSGLIESMAFDTGKNIYTYNYEGKLTHVQEYKKKSSLKDDERKLIRLYAGTKDIAWIGYYHGFDIDPARTDYYDNGQIYASSYRSITALDKEYCSDAYEKWENYKAARLAEDMKEISYLKNKKNLLQY